MPTDKSDPETIETELVTAWQRANVLDSAGSLRR
jgi:hypothetical protein